MKRKMNYNHLVKTAGYSTAVVSIIALPWVVGYLALRLPAPIGWDEMYGGREGFWGAIYFEWVCGLISIVVLIVVVWLLWKLFLAMKALFWVAVNYIYEEV